jgi:hypothetical protein
MHMNARNLNTGCVSFLLFNFVKFSNLMGFSVFSKKDLIIF